MLNDNIKNNVKNKPNQDPWEEQFAVPHPIPREHPATAVLACDLPESAGQFRSPVCSVDKGVSSSAPSRLGMLFTDPSPQHDGLAGKQKLVHLG